MKTLLWGIVIVALLAGVGVLLFSSKAPLPENVSIIDADTTVAGDYAVAEGAKVILKNNAVLTVTGNLTARGELACDGGALRIVVKGTADFEHTVRCTRPESGLPEGDIGSGILIVAGKGLVFGKNATIVSNGHVQIVDSAEKLATTQESIETLYADAARDSGGGPRLGPFIPKETVGKKSGAVIVPARFSFAPGAPEEILASSGGWNFVKRASAQGAPAPCVDQNGNVVANCVRISGNWVMGSGTPPPPGVNVPTPPKGVNHIILNFNFGPNQEVHLADFSLSGPDGRPGTDDNAGDKCITQGGNGEDAFRLNVRASNIIINNFNLWLGNGGRGGNAETGKDCDPGRATGGKGGGAGNFKMSASGDFAIEGAFNIYPGMGGEGGSATAHGKKGEDGCPGKKGGDATARGGDGGPNKKELAAVGNVSGISNVTVGEVVGGAGGVATADPGAGGSGTGCTCGGGKGGDGTAIGGRGGDASVKIPSAFGTANGGNGGNVDSHGGTGGTGGFCGPEGPGGNGGNGGNALSNKGQAGSGTSADGSPGNVTNEKGGDGGNGGDGCGPGGGGKSGKGKPPGTDGKPGKNVCVEKKDTSTSVTPPPTGVTTGGTSGGVTPPPPPTGTTGGTPPPSGGTGKQIQVIQYGGKYLPVDQLIVEDEAGCGANHWHAAGGVVRATDGSLVPDPGPQCGYGKVSERPVITTTVPQ